LGIAAGNEDLASLGKKELLSMLRFGADRIFAAAEGRPPSDAELDAIMDRTEKQAAVKSGEFPLVIISRHMYSRQGITEHSGVIRWMNRRTQTGRRDAALHARIDTVCQRLPCKYAPATPK
jgi:hypothetical protein